MFFYIWNRDKKVKFGGMCAGAMESTLTKERTKERKEERLQTGMLQQEIEAADK